MNRDIEFRGFLEGYNNNKCFEISVLALKECGWACDKGIGVSIPYQPHIKIMQYTGLKDKNGKKIFEGDIMKNKQGGIGIVKYSKYAEFILDFDIFVSSFNPSILRRYEVIGNIYDDILESKGE